MTQRAERHFTEFSAGLMALCAVSDSAIQSIESALSGDRQVQEAGPAAVVRGLAASAFSHTLTDNAVGWADVQLIVSGGSVRYRTAGGLVFGWAKVPPASVDYDARRCGYTFFLERPIAHADRPSSLMASAESNGWAVQS